MKKNTQKKSIDKAIHNLIKFSKQQTEWHDRLDDLLQQWLLPAANKLGITSSEISEEIEDMGCGHMLFGYVFEEFASVLWDNEERSLIEEYIKRRGWRETAYGQRYLQAMNDTEIQLWEVTDVNAESHVDVRLHGTNDVSIRVHEKSATKFLKQWDCLAARVIKLDNTLTFTEGILILPPSEAQSARQMLGDAKADVIQLYHSMLQNNEIDALPDDVESRAEEEANRLWPEILLTAWILHLHESLHQPSPILQNFDGEMIQPATVRFSLTASPDEITSMLDQVAELQRDEDSQTWTWFDQPYKETIDGEPMATLGTLSLSTNALELMVNSKERADRGRDWLSRLLQGLIHRPLIAYENIEDQIQKRAEANPEGFDLSQTEEGQAIIKNLLDLQYRKTLDEPIPMLDGKTPRACSVDPNSHDQVITWIKYIENQHSASSSQPYDFSWVWQELGLEKHQATQVDTEELTD